MNEFQLEKQLTALADDEIRDPDFRTELISMINNNRKLKFIHDVQYVTSKNLIKTLVRYPVPDSLKIKLLKLLNEGGKYAGI